MSKASSKSLAFRMPETGDNFSPVNGNSLPYPPFSSAMSMVVSSGTSMPAIAAILVAGCATICLFSSWFAGDSGQMAFNNFAFSSEPSLNRTAPFFFMAVIFQDKDLHIYDYNRVVRDLNGLTSQQFIQAVKEAGFVVDPISDDNFKPQSKHTFGMYLDGTWYELTAQKDILSDDPIEGLDVSILQTHLLEPILGIENPRTDKRIDFVGGIRGISELERRCSMDMKVAFALYPVTIADLLTVADNDMVMGLNPNERKIWRQ